MLGTVHRVGSVLDLFSQERAEWGATDLARELGLAKSQAHEILSSMARIGLLQKTPGARYRLGWRTVRLGAAAMQNEGLVSAAGPAMRRLAEVHPELSVHLAVWDGDSAIYVGRQVGAEVDENVARMSRTGNEAPLHCTSLGKVLAATRTESELESYLSRPRLERYTRETIIHPASLRSELRAVRERGFAIDQGELESDMTCLATPVTGEDEHVIAAVGVCLPPNAGSLNTEIYMRSLKNSSRQIARAVSRLTSTPAATVA